MATRTIPVNGGLVNSRDESLLEIGELSRADDSEYLPNDPSLHKVSGHTAFNSTAEAGPIKGVAYLEFESSGSTDVLLAHATTTYRSDPVGDTGTFTDPTNFSAQNMATGLTGGTTMDAVHYNDRHYLLNGVDGNREVISTAESIVTATGIGNIVVQQQALTAPDAPSVVLAQTGGSLTFATGDDVTIWVT